MPFSKSARRTGPDFPTTTENTPLVEPSSRSPDPPGLGQITEINRVTQDQVSGPTQTASETLTTSHWESHPFFARSIRLVIFLTPLAIAIVFSIWASRRFPPDTVNLADAVWLWWLGVAIASTLLVRVLERIVTRLTPLALMFRLSLIFPDQAPSRFSVALKTGSPRTLQRKLAEIQETGEAFNEDHAYSEQMLELVAVLANHDRMTRGHAERVRAYSELIGEEMGLGAEDLGKLRWSALLHDMGKLHVPSEILNKAGRPDEHEWAILKEHPAKAEDYLEPLADWLGEWRLAAVGHHERWDGNGYPAGQAGNEIPLSARIVAVADAYDVMTSTRSYKKAMPADLARQEIADKAGSQFDPAVARAFLAISLGDLRRTAGPLAFLSNLPLLRNIPIGQSLSGAAAGTATSVPSAMAAATAAAATAAAVAAPVEVPEPAPPAIAFAQPAIPEIAAAGLVGFEDEPLFGSIVLTGDGPFTVTVIEPPARGTLVMDTETQVLDGAVLSVSYSPAPNQFGMDEFTLEACDVNNACVEQVISISVSAVNDPPVAAPDAVAATEGEVLIIGFASLLANDTDIEESILTVASFTSPENGFILQTTDSLIFTPDPGFAGDTTFTYTTSDGTSESEPTTVTVSVEALPNRQPTLSFNPTSLRENLPAGTAAGTAVATDPEGEAISYTIVGGSAAQLFAIDSVTGELETTAPFDFESSPVLTVVLRATDAFGHSTSQTTTISITDQNEPPVLGTLGPLSISESSSAGAPVTNGAIVGTDPEDDALTFSLLDPLERFTIDPITGEIVRTATPLDFETQPSHEVTIVATDPDGESSTTTVLIAVLDDNDVPTLQPFVASLSIAENQPSQQLGQAVATDADEDIINYSLTGAKSSRFSVTADGEISTNGPLNFEDVPQYQLTLTVTDGRNAALSASTPLTIDVLDVNEAPQIAPLPTFFVADNSPVGSIVGPSRAVATDVDGDTLTYGLVDASNSFTINPVTGTVEVAGPIDAEAAATHTVSITATDPGGLQAIEEVEITVGNINEPPSLTVPTTPVLVQENSALGTLVTSSVTATDQEADTLTYSLGDRSGLFTIDSSTGDVSLAGPIDFETTPNLYTVTVLVNDLASGGTATVTATFDVAVTNQNEAPIVRSPQTFFIDENPARGDSPTPLAVLASDIDGDTLTFSLDDPSNSFTIDSLTGVITVTATGDGLDFEEDDTYPIVVTVTDPGGLSAELSTVIEVGDVNEAPILFVPFGGWSIDENSPVGTGLAPRVTAIDPEGAALTYSLDDLAGLFDIDPISGELELRGTVNFEAAPNSFDVEVTVDDGFNFDTRAVTISINDVPEAPRIVTSILNSVSENTAVGTTVATMQATDDDGDASTWSIDGGSGAAIFDIDLTSGELTLAVAVDFETLPNEYTLDITATDPDLLSDTETFKIDITDVKEAPTIDSGQVFTIEEERPANTPVSGPVTFTDPEGDPVITWSLEDPTSSFRIDPTTGQIESLLPLDYDNGTTTFEVDVVAAAPAGASAETVKINLLPVDERPTFIAGDPTDLAVRELSTVGDTIGSLGVDNPEREALTFSIETGTGVGVFDIDASTGEIELTGTIDFETGPGSYSLDVRVEDADNPTLFDTRTFDLIIADDPEQAFLVRTIAFEIEENVPLGSVVPQRAQGVDPDGGSTQLVFELVDAEQFAIDPATGEISFVDGQLDAVAQPMYPITIRLYDASGPVPELNDSWTTNIVITGVDELPIITAAPTFSVRDDALPGAALATMAAVDPEGDGIADWEIVGGTGRTFFDIDAMGRVTLAATIDFDDASSYTLAIEAIDGGTPAQSSEPATVTVNVTSQFGPAPSPFFREVVFNEVYFAANQTAEEGDIDFVEIVNHTNAAIDLTGWTLRDSPIGEQDPNGNFSLQSPSIGLVNLGRITIPIPDEAALRRNDDLFLYDGSNLLVAYIAWGDVESPNAEIGIRPPIDTWDLWDPTHERGLTFTDGASISVTPDGQNTTDSGCWERTGSGGAADCGDAPPTLDIDPRPAFSHSLNWPNTN